MGVHFLGRDGGEPAQARQAVAFHVDQAVSAPRVLGREDLVQVVGDRLVIEFLEATGAVHSHRIVTFV
jgi:hypothetical protein